MVSMAPNTQRYDYSYKYNKNFCSMKENPKSKGFVEGTMYDLLQSDQKFAKTVKIVELANLKNLLGNNANGLTLFVTEDTNIPDKFMEDLDLFTAENFINAYLVPGIASKEYLLQNGSAVYIPRKYHYNNPLFVEVDRDTQQFTVNRVGQYVRSISCTNGYIHVLDNLAQISYIN